uniref:non-specific serine/threonine protein kinase n=1 Tax=Arundo donax TaxID=35708 RepID=A0A0A9DFU5_ARUDO
MVIWQSFDSPTNILLSEGHLGFNTITGKNVTLERDSCSIPLGTSDYSLSLDTTRRRGFIIQQGGDGGLTFIGSFPRWMDIHEDGDYGLTFNDAHTYIYLNGSGFVRFAKQGECDSILWSAPESSCDFDSYCGPYGLCTRSGSCICPDGFEQAPLAGKGCLRVGILNFKSCSYTKEDVAFFPIDGIHKFPDYSYSLEVKNIKECEASCLRDCACTAFAYNITCLLWFQELRNTVLLDSISNGSRIYVRTAMNQQTPSSRFSSLKEVIVLSVLGVIALVVGLILLCRCRRKLMKARTVDLNGGLIVFSFAQIKNSTKNFSEKLGEGGFGYVFKGTMPISTTVAVKMLKGLGQGDKLFRTEVQTIGMIQHTNLVRLLGFCADGTRRLLVYEYMLNGSLNSHLFCSSSAKLSWELRYRVALGTARGLAYLHEECKDCIVHCDMKPDNILLGEQFCPKIADFGMAKILGREFSKALTTMRGTIGYLAPEWISGLPITHKVDVYSYGMMLLEIISGRRNSEKIKEGKFTYFPIYAAVKVNEGDIMCLLDSSLEGNADAEQLKRACRVACWCIQDAEDHRPMMGQVVHMMEGVMDVEVPPVPRSLQNYVGMEDSYSADLDSF